MKKPLRIFYSYSHLDSKYLENLKSSLALLRNEGIIEDWGGRDIDAGNDWKKLVDLKLEQADIVLLLVSPNFLASEYCYEYEMKRALIKHKLNLAKVIPIILTDSEFRQTPFATIEVLPQKGFAIDNKRWTNANYAYTNIARGIRAAIDNIDNASYSTSFGLTDVNEIMNMAKSKELRQYAIEKLNLKINEALQLTEIIDASGVYWFLIALAKLGGQSVKPTIRKALNSKNSLVVLGAKDAMKIIENEKH